MKRCARVLLSAVFALLAGCGALQDKPVIDAGSPSPAPVPSYTEISQEEARERMPGDDGQVIADRPGDIATETPNENISTEEKAMHMRIGDTEVPVTWEGNASVDALRELLPLTVGMSMYGGFEQVGSLGQSLPRNDEQTATDYGDIVLYSGDQIVVFYGTNRWAYTRLGHIDLSRQEMDDLLGHGDVEVSLWEE